MRKLLFIVIFFLVKNIVYAQHPAANDNVGVVSSYYECLFKTHDFQKLVTLLAPDATYYQAEGLPYGGTFVGAENWIRMFTQASSFFDLQIEKEPVYFLNDRGKEIILRFTIKCTAKKNGHVISMPIAEHFVLNAGQIVSIRPFYFDTLKFSKFLK